MLLLICALVLVLRPVHPEFTLLQTPIERLQPQHLLERLPILIDSRVVNADQVAIVCFKHMCLFKWDMAAAGVHRSLWGCLLLHAHAGQEAHVTVSHPSRELAMQVRLKPHQLLVVPRWWPVAVPPTVRAQQLFTLF